MSLQHMKRITAIGMALLMAGTMFGTIGSNSKTADLSISATAATTPTSGSCGTNLTWSYNAAEQSLTISGSGTEIKDYNFGAAPWYQY